MARKPSVKKPAPFYKPPDWLKGGTRVGQKYTTYDNFRQGTLDFGKGKGPGEPYRQVERTVPTAKAGAAQWALKKAQNRTYDASAAKSQAPSPDPRTEAIRRRLRGL
jgi:hypothetical protein